MPAVLDKVIKQAGLDVAASLNARVVIRPEAVAPGALLRNWTIPGKVILADVWLYGLVEDLSMAWKRHKAEEIVAKLRQVGVLTAQGGPVAGAIRSIGVTDVTYFRWRTEYGGPKGDQLKNLKGLEAEKRHLRRAVSDLTFEKLNLKKAASGNFGAPRVAALEWSMWSPSMSCPNRSLVAFSGSIVPRSARSQCGPMTNWLWPSTSRRSLSNTAAMPTAASRHFCGSKGCRLNMKRVARIWRREGLKVPAKQPKRGRPGVNGGPCVQLLSEYPSQVWSYDFVEDRTHEGREYRILNFIDGYTRECIAIQVNRKLKAIDGIDVLSAFPSQCRYKCIRYRVLGAQSLGRVLLKHVNGSEFMNQYRCRQSEKFVELWCLPDALIPH